MEMRTQKKNTDGRRPGTKDFIDIKKGLYLGHGVDMTTRGKMEMEPVYLNWGTLNSHLQVFGTTRMGKTRLMAFIERQLIEKGDHVLLFDPKGSKGQEIIAWTMQYANQCGRLDDTVYISPSFPDISQKLNPVFGMVNEEISSTIENMIEADEQFYTDIANEITLSALLSLEFIERVEDSMVVEMMMLKENIDANVVCPLIEINNYLHPEGFNHNGVEFDVRRYFLEQNPEDEKWRNRVEAAYKKVEQQYTPRSGVLPLRTFVTFRDLAVFSNIEKIISLQKAVETALDKAVKEVAAAKQGRIETHITDDDIRLGEEALREIEKVASRDKTYFSKVSSTYATTLTKLSSGDVGKLICDCRINPLRDRLVSNDKGVIMVMQPFPLVYDTAANTMVKIMMSMFSSIVGEIGQSGREAARRINVMVDEAGAIVSRQVAENLANKGGGLSLSLFLFSQSLADYVNKLDTEGAAILADNMNTKGFFRVNHPASAEEMSAMIGGKKVGAATYTTSDNREGRAQARTAEEELVPPALLQQLDPLTWVLKTDNKVFMMSSAWQEDPILHIVLPRESEVERVEKEEQKAKEAIGSLSY